MKTDGPAMALKGLLHFANFFRVTFVNGIVIVFGSPAWRDDGL